MIFLYATPPRGKGNAAHAKGIRVSGLYGFILGGQKRVCRLELGKVRLNYGVFKLRTECGVDGMGDVAIGTVRVLSRRHNDEVAILGVNNFDVVHGQLLVKGDGNNSLHRAFVKKFANFDVCDLHVLFSTCPYAVTGAFLPPM